MKSQGLNETKNAEENVERDEDPSYRNIITSSDIAATNTTSRK
jgi:hypothetical protein